MKVAKRGRLNLLGFVAGTSVLSACSNLTNVDDLEHRATVVNTNMAEYSNKGVALNVLRAIDRSPLAFAQLAQVQGHNTLTGTLGIPSVSFGPHLSTNPRAYTIGPNTISRGFGTDFTINAIDDPNTYQALFSSVDTKTIRLFLDQGYPREVVFMLFIDHVRIKTDASSRWITYNNDPSRPTYPEFLRIFYSLLENGLTIEKQAGQPESSVAQTQSTASRVCMDKSAQTQDGNSKSLADTYVDHLLYLDINTPGVDKSKFREDRTTGLIDLINGEKILRNPGTGIFLRQSREMFRFLNDYRKPAGESSDAATPFSCDFESPEIPTDRADLTQLEIVMQLQPQKSKTDSLPTVTGTLKKKESKTAERDKLTAPSNDTLLLGGDGFEIQFDFRSAYGAYLFLGELGGGKDGYAYNVPIFSVSQNFLSDAKLLDKYGNQVSNLTPAAADEHVQTPIGYIDYAAREIMNLTPDITSLLQINRVTTAAPFPPCFVNVDYGKETWCVAETSKTTKLVFGMLHQLVQLYSVPSSQLNNTVSVRPVQ